MQGGGFHRSTKCECKVLYGKVLQQILIADDFTLLCDFDGTIEYAPWLRKNRIMGWAAAAADSSTTTVEEPKSDTVLTCHIA